MVRTFGVCYVECVEVLRHTKDEQSQICLCALLFLHVRRACIRSIQYLLAPRGILAEHRDEAIDFNGVSLRFVTEIRL